MTSDTDEGPLSGGCFIVILILMMAMIIGVLILASEDETKTEKWLNENILHREPKAEVFVCPEGEEPEPIETVCDAYCMSGWTPPQQGEVLEFTEYACAMCPTCPTLYELPGEVDIEVLPTYLRDANKIIDNMLALETMMYSLEDLIFTFGSNKAAMANAFTDKQWLALYNEMQSSRRQVRWDLIETWAPPPYDSSNPLLDSYGRMMIAFLLIDRGAESFERSIEDRDVNHAYGWDSEMDLFHVNIDYARIGLDLAGPSK